MTNAPPQHVGQFLRDVTTGNIAGRTEEGDDSQGGLLMPLQLVRNDWCAFNATKALYNEDWAEADHWLVKLGKGIDAWREEIGWKPPPIDSYEI